MHEISAGVPPLFKDSLGDFFAVLAAHVDDLGDGAPCDELWGRPTVTVKVTVTVTVTLRSRSRG